MTELMIVLVVATSIWVLLDSKSIGIKKGKITGFFDLGPTDWFASCLLLWILYFPAYLVKRNDYKRLANCAPPEPYCAQSPGAELCGAPVIKCQNSSDEFANTPARPGFKAVRIALLLGILLVTVILTIEAPSQKSDFFSITGPRRALYVPVVTLTGYQRIEKGITYQHARRIIGTEGVEIARTNVAGFISVMYSWKNPDGSNMNAMFQNGELISKAQFGLR